LNITGSVAIFLRQKFVLKRGKDINMLLQWRKCIAVGIILSFICVSLSPTIHFRIVKASTDNDCVEVTTQACGIQGYGNTTVRLTKHQYQNLESYLTEFRARLNQTTTREKETLLFKEAVVELNKYGLLPKGMSVEQVQKLVTENNARPIPKKIIESPKPSKSGSGLAITNILCLLSMVSLTPGTDLTIGLLAVPSAILLILFLIWSFHFNNIQLALLVLPLFFISLAIGLPSFVFNMLSPVLFWSMISIGSGYAGASVGLKGLQQINGNINYILGYKGLRIWFPIGVDTRYSFYLGQALVTAGY
jgi:hypothetical protein